MKQQLNIIHDHKITFEGRCGNYTVLGRLAMDLSALKTTIHLSSPERRKQRLKVDLYDYSQIQKNCINLSEKEEYNYAELEADLLQLTDLLEQHREMIFEKEYQTEQPKRPKISLAREKEAISLLSSKNLLITLNSMIGEAGIIGEDSNRLLTFLAGLSYKCANPLHVLIQSNSGSGKSHLINSVASCFPPEDIISFSRVTSKSLYHYRKGELLNKLVLIQDFDGLDQEALFALRELQSYGSLSSSVTFKDRFGSLTSRVQTVEGHFASFGATTKTVYTDNESRSILLRIDESIEQTNKIIAFQNELNLGIKDKKQIANAQLELSNLIRQLKPKKIVNPLSTRIVLPFKAKMIRRLNQQFQDFISVITYLHQYQRETDEEGRIITTEEDVKNAIELFFESIWLKIDELDGSLRKFFEQLKAFIQKEERDTFNQREIRQELNISKSHCHRMIKTLLELEYIKVVAGSSTRGYTYKIEYWDEFNKDREAIKQGLLNQLKAKGVPA